jgi:hypothetical protein
MQRCRGEGLAEEAFVLTGLGVRVCSGPRAKLDVTLEHGAGREPDFGPVAVAAGRRHRRRVGGRRSLVEHVQEEALVGDDAAGLGGRLLRGLGGRHLEGPEGADADAAVFARDPCDIRTGLGTTSDLHCETRFSFIASYYTNEGTLQVLQHVKGRTRHLRYFYSYMSGHLSSVFSIN